jgi:hypothetical protein
MLALRPMRRSDSCVIATLLQPTLFSTYLRIQNQSDVLPTTLCVRYAALRLYRYPTPSVSDNGVTTKYDYAAIHTMEAGMTDKTEYSK